MNTPLRSLQISPPLLTIQFIIQSSQFYYRYTTTSPTYPPYRKTLIAPFNSLLYIYSPSYFYPQLSTTMRSATQQSKITFTKTREKKKRKKSMIKCQVDQTCATERKKALQTAPTPFADKYNKHSNARTSRKLKYIYCREKQGKCAPREIRCSFVLRLKETAISGKK